MDDFCVIIFDGKVDGMKLMGYGVGVLCGNFWVKICFVVVVEVWGGIVGVGRYYVVY